MLRAHAEKACCSAPPSVAERRGYRLRSQPDLLRWCVLKHGCWDGSSWLQRSTEWVREGPVGSLVAKRQVGRRENLMRPNQLTHAHLRSLRTCAVSLACLECVHIHCRAGHVLPAIGAGGFQKSWPVASVKGGCPFQQLCSSICALVRRAMLSRIAVVSGSGASGNAVRAAAVARSSYMMCRPRVFVPFCHELRTGPGLVPVQGCWLWGSASPVQAGMRLASGGASA